MRRLGAVLNFDRVRSALAGYYSPTGRPSVDPELMLRMLLIGYAYGIRSERLLCGEVHLNLAYRWFCRLGLEGAMPDHSTFSKNRYGRFRESHIYRVFRPLASGMDFQLSRFAWLVAGGPIASLALAIVCGVVSAQGNGHWNWIGTLFWASTFLLILAGIPFSSGLNKSDGARLWQLIHHPEEARRWVSVLALQSEEAQGLRPREWNSMLFNQILEVGPFASEYLYCQLLAFYRKLDEGREVDALEHLEKVLAASARGGKALRQAFFLEAASASGMVRKNPTQARTWLERACKLGKPESTDAVEASIAMCEGRYEEAASYWKSARERVTRRKLDSGLSRFAKEKWATYEAACGGHQG